MMDETVRDNRGWSYVASVTSAPDVTVWIRGWLRTPLIYSRCLAGNSKMLCDVNDKKKLFKR